MKKRRLLSSALALAIAIGVSACGSSPEQQYLGTWVFDDGDSHIELVIENGGSGSRTATGGSLGQGEKFSQPIEWSVENDKLKVEMNNYIGNDMTDTFTLSEDGNSLASTSYSSEYFKEGTEPEKQTEEPTQEELLESAEEYDFDAFQELRDENPAKAKQEYDGIVFRRTGYIESIETDYIIVSDYLAGVYVSPIIAELPTDTIAALDQGQEVTVCGTFEYVDDPYIPHLVDAFIVE